MNIATFDLLGIRLDAITKGDLFRVIVKAASERTRCVIGNHNLHSVYLWAQTPIMRKFYSSANYVQIDGMPLVWLGRLFGLPFSSSHRITNIDLLPLLADEAVSRRWRLFHLGSEPGVAEKAADKLRTRYPGLQIQTRHGYFDTKQSGADNQIVLAEIRDYAPDILMVGMGMPRQEIWIAENLEAISSSVVLCCGGMMDLVAGQIPTPPRWLGDIGLEWLFRLISQPIRTGRRYLVEPWVIVTRIALAYLKTGRARITLESTTE